MDKDFKTEGYLVKVGGLYLVKWIDKTDARMSTDSTKAQVYTDKIVARQNANRLLGTVADILVGPNRVEDLLIEEKLTIKMDDIVEIQAKGVRLMVKVLSANNYGMVESDWYIESEIISTGAYSYWKQSSDGGHIVSLNGKEVS